jgi:geranylgeranyl pyrophosphate synthase
MNKTSFTFAVACARQNLQNRVCTKYMAVRDPLVRSFSPRAAVAINHRKIARSRVPREPQFDERSTAILRKSFYASLPLPSALDPDFEDALRHILSNPGSMVRPRMVQRVASAYGLDPEAAHNVAFALEYFHTASLIFDDLPCMDDAVERRGVPCVHVQFGEASAILSALALINRAYALVWRAVADAPRERRHAVMEYVEKRLGIEGLLNGQSLDLRYAKLPHTQETTERIAHGKTVSLIRLTLLLPAMLGGAPVREVQLLERMAVCWGLGYQILDDLKDVLQDAADTGKTAARDELLDRPNIARAIGVCGAVERLEKLMRIGDQTLRRLLLHRPQLSFLSQLRIDLESELREVTDSALRNSSVHERSLLEICGAPELAEKTAQSKRP